MKSFLEYVAADILKKYGSDLSDIVVVFPNKRAALFLNDSLARLSGNPIWTPTYITISELFRRHSKLKVADPIKLICDLHKTFVSCTGIDETLDHFYGWGQLLVADFDDVDKNMANAKQLFSNLSDIHELDDISYLTEDQKEMIKKFFSNFSDDHNSELKKRFIQLWSHFYDIYTTFNKCLQEQGLAYEGALYRQVADDENIEFHHKKYLFVGFNMMQVVEQKILNRLQHQGKAAFYWDFDKYYMNGNNEAGHYISQYLKYYPNELSDYDQTQLYDNLSKPKNITYISAPTENIQARYVHDWLLENNRYKKGRKVAIVLSDESLLQSVLHSLPKQVDALNVTLGYPLQQTPFYSLIQLLIKLQIVGHTKFSSTYRLHYVLLTLRHPYMRYISERYTELLDKLSQKKQFYPSREYLNMDGDAGLSLLFSDIDEAANSDEANKKLLQYLLNILKLIGTNAKDLEDPLFHESLFRTYTLLNRLYSLIETDDLQVDGITLERLIQQLITTTSIPFHGEPAIGIQIMGVLETRNLDFEHILVLSCNEGKLPKGINDSSFIPYSLRKAYGLTTVDNKVAIYAYYYHSMLQRANDVTLTYNNATEEGQSGEMSRFMLQMMVESKQNIVRKTLVAGQKPQRLVYDDVKKLDEHLDVLEKKKTISPTFINTYQRCQKRFYFKYVVGLNEPDEIDEDEVDNRIFGTIFHRSAELFYLRFVGQSNIEMDSHGNTRLKHPICITPGELEMALKNDSLIEQIVEQAFREILFKVSMQEYRPKYNGLQLINKEVICSYLKQLINVDKRLAPFYILGLELEVTTHIPVQTRHGERQMRIGGTIDRLDVVSEKVPAGQLNLVEHIRVIDYKTGRAPSYHPANLDDIFGTDAKALKKHNDYYLQSMLYSIIVRHNQVLNPSGDPVSPALLFIQNAGAENYNPILKIGSAPIEDVSVYEKEFWQNMIDVVDDIYNPQIPFRPTDDKKRCESCPYAALCR